MNKKDRFNHNDHKYGIEKAKETEKRLYISLALLPLIRQFSLFVVLLAPALPAGNPLNLNWQLGSAYEEGYYKEGDFLLGAVIDLHHLWKVKVIHKKEKPRQIRYYTDEYLQHFRHHLVIIYAVEEINSNEKLLPNITLGFHIYDSLAYESQAQKQILRILSGGRNMVPNYLCSSAGMLAAFIGDKSSPNSLSMATLIQMYHYTQVRGNAYTGTESAQ
ncbi:hypothetical protein XELAEV_18028436mg [Xenopus laevis]|uniref:Receptor ligand binding region domain-containing protein n=1 Tax=Xenopus laevis TaxID=8355 RepID=A0A974CZR1_XENLA|nr:hypothetical protein XELAEV_18028436mg [Xenopus laevis]